MNGLLFRSVDLTEALNKIPAMSTVPLWFDAKGRQLRVEEAIYHRDHLELVMNHNITGLKMPHPIIFKAGEDWAMVDEISDRGRRLHLRGDEHPIFRVKPGDSVHFRNPAMDISDPLFTSDEKMKIERVVSLGYKNFYLSYVESQRDVDEFRELVGPDASVILKIESLKGLDYVRDHYRSQPNTRLACARGDLYVEVEKPHEIVKAQKLIVERCANAVVGSRLLLSLFTKSVPACSDICELALLKQQGYSSYLLCDDLCKSGPALHRAVAAFKAVMKDI